jgi:hypothetical protein
MKYLYFSMEMLRKVLLLMDMNEVLLVNVPTHFCPKHGENSAVVSGLLEN